MTITNKADPVLDAVTASRAAGIALAPIGEELERWQIGQDVDVKKIVCSGIKFAARNLVEDVFVGLTRC